MTSHESETVEVFRRNIIRRIDSGEVNVSELCRKSKFDRTALYHFLNNSGGITLAKADNLAKALGSSLVEMLQTSD